MGHWVKIKKESSLPDLMTLHIYAVSVVVGTDIISLPRLYRRDTCRRHNWAI